MSGMLTLPEGCIAAVISFTTPRDACHLACVSTTFRSATDSDVVWDRFLSPEYLSAISYPGSVSGSSSSSTWFPEVAMPVKINPFGIGGKISTSLLSPMTTCIAYLVFAKNWMSNLYSQPVEVVVGLAGSNNGQNRTIYFHREHQDEDDDGFFPKKRGDWWVESELGEFYNRGDGDGELFNNY
ncbi:hypothetical protein LWI29_013092 [Acer saccharum]|uniref:F-box domain-containing protein n=1 Tax=Acer saccharum TaxID=4024 RepID=A0AA39VBZ6_ACESA|nr:hypothetical protein LWI29_013092 [Acer saccharum]